MDVTINSNKNTNKYIMEQECNFKNNYRKQTIIEPENIKGIEIISENGNVEIKNSKLNLNEMYKEYPHVSENMLWLESFIKEYSEDGAQKNIYEDQNYIIMELNLLLYQVHILKCFLKERHQ